MILIVVLKRLVVGIWAWLNEGGNEDKVDRHDAQVPSLPPIEESQFETENEDTKKDNDEARTLEVDEEKKCEDGIDEALEGSKFSAAVTPPSVIMATGALISRINCLVHLNHCLPLTNLFFTKKV